MCVTLSAVRMPAGTRNRMEGKNDIVETAAVAVFDAMRS
jgi:hypothetical protein